MPYRIVMTDLFYPSKPTRDGDHFATAASAVARAKFFIDRDLLRFWAQICRYGQVEVPTVEALIAKYDAMAELPDVHGPDGTIVFAGRPYLLAQAERMVAEAEAAHRRWQADRLGFWARLGLKLVDFEPPSLPRWMTAPVDPRKVLGVFVGLVLLIAMIRTAFRLW